MVEHYGVLVLNGWSCTVLKMHSSTVDAKLLKSPHNAYIYLHSV